MVEVYAFCKVLFLFFIAVAQLRGDPHITTIDGVAYTFNGHGEFILLESTGNDNKLIVQVSFE